MDFKHFFIKILNFTMHNNFISFFFFFQYNRNMIGKKMGESTYFQFGHDNTTWSLMGQQTLLGLNNKGGGKTNCFSMFVFKGLIIQVAKK